MPACLTHHYFAHEVMKLLPENTIADVTAFDWGAQGPDFLFCHRYLPWMKGRSLKEYGNKIHSDPPSATFDILRRFVNSHTDPSYRSYVYGFLCHYALDTSAHPFVNFFSQQYQAERPYETTGTLHGEIESSLDTIILRSEAGTLPTEVNLKRMFPKNEVVQRRIARLYSDLLFHLYGENIPEQEVLVATKDAHLVFTLLTDRTTLKKKVFNILEKGKAHTISSHIVPLTEDPNIDYANLQHLSWDNRGEDSCEDFFQIYQRAQEKAVTLITSFDSCNFSELTEEKPFD